MVAMPIFPITFIGGDEFYAGAFITAEGLQKIGNNIRDFTVPLTTSLREVIIPSIQKNFASGGRPPWAPLEVSTVEKRKATGPILDRTGFLKSVATSEAIWTITTDTIEVSGMDTVPYAKYHQVGTKNMVARVFILFQPEDEAKIEEIFSLWFEEQIRSGGFKG
jgi:phage gpG-like protein